MKAPHTPRVARSSFSPRKHPRFFQVVTWIVVGSQLLLPIQGSLSLLAADEIAPVPASAPAATNVVANRTVPDVQRPPAVPAFSDEPSDAEFFRARVFAEPLVPLGGATTVEENELLKDVLLAFLRRSSPDDVSAIVQFLEAQPRSAWRGSLLVNLGIVYRKSGYFTKALATWEGAWAALKADTTPHGKALGDRAVGELLELNARLGRMERLGQLLAEIEGRDVRGPATEKVAGAREGLWLMQNQPGLAFRCGPYALDCIRKSIRATDTFHEKIKQSQSTTNGIQLTAVRNLANELGMGYRMAWRSAGTKVMLPAVVHWKAGHYAALVREQNGLFLVQDPTFGEDIWISQRALDDEGSGYFLIPQGDLPQGWRAVSEDEGAKVWGKGSTSDNDPDQTKPDNDKEPRCNGQTPMAQYAMHAMVVSLNIVDTPVGYTPPRGPAVYFEVTYNQREANQPSVFPYSNLGNKWTFNWLAYITDDPANQLAPASYYVMGGGTERYSNFNTNTQAYEVQKESRTVLVRTSATSYERRLPGGGKQVFDVPDGATASPRKIFLTQIVDAANNTLTFTYNTNFCLAAVSDAIGQVTTLEYGLTNDVRKITRVTDPFGRYASFQYNGSGQLTNITDILGITSSFTYGSGDFINSLTTPYGTSTFTQGAVGRNRWLEAVDPIGQKERMEYFDNNGSLASTESVVPSGSGFSFLNNYMQYRNSFYWNKRVMQLYPNDLAKAKRFHWLHSSLGQTSGIKESVLEPLESRVWFAYAGQANTAVEGTNGQPSIVARVLDDGTSQIYRYEYNALGKPTKVTDPTNRVTRFTYAGNLIDLLEVRQQIGTNAANTELLGLFTYNASHLPLTSVDASGQTNYFGYNVNGQLKALTNALGETVTMTYNPDGYLTNLTGSLPGSTTSFTYDGYGRVRTVTDSEGFTVTTDYDAADRPTKITFPDNTYEQIVYDRLDPVLSRDRRGHWASSLFDSLRRLTDTFDAAGRHTHLEWCGCGALESITDPLQRTTTWLRDLQGRVTAKIYPDATQVTSAYETNTSRLKLVTDAKNQTTLYQYFIDNNVKQVSYSNAVVATPTVSFTYDTNYNRLLTMTDGIGTTSYGYLAVTNTQLGAGQLASVDGPLANDTITYTYDSLGRVKSRAIDGVAQAVTYDTLGRVTVVTNALGSFTNAYVGDRVQLLRQHE